ncbi:MAG: octanoyltransferase [Planctomycetota bacterium]|nr:MAG: octanoyltransferase [Planctomycetota bacterium]
MFPQAGCEHEAPTRTADRVTHDPRLNESALSVRDLGLIDYAEAWALQKQLVDARRDVGGVDTLLVCEHPAVITTGRGTQNDFLREARFPIHEVERGGEATYHGPGQIVVYPIVGLAEGARDLHAYLRALEQACLDACAQFGLGAGRREGATGVWVDGARKLASLGVAARRWVTYHGLALNHSTDLSHFEAIQPCGFEASVMTSLQRELDARCPARDDFRDALVEHLQQQLHAFREIPS